jgi:hypothetical protein
LGPRTNPKNNRPKTCDRRLKTRSKKKTRNESFETENKTKDQDQETR